MKWTWPIILTSARIVFIPILVLVFYLPIESANILATLIFALASATDWLDGYLARKLNQTTDFGAFLDPVADKLMVAIALILLVESHQDLWFTIPAAVIVGREIAISALREWMAEIGERTQVAVSSIGKVKTTVQMVSILMLLYHEPIGPLPIDYIGLTLLYVAAGLTLWSMAIYLQAAWPILNNVDKNSKE